MQDEVSKHNGWLSRDGLSRSRHCWAFSACQTHTFLCFSAIRQEVVSAPPVGWVELASLFESWS